MRYSGRADCVWLYMSFFAHCGTTRANSYDLPLGLPYFLCIPVSPSSFDLYRSSLYGYSSSYSGGGACLSHDHGTQFRFVLQSFTLWREIMSCMPRLWMLADHDMTHEQYRYRS
jgi:hypothetical protein